MQFLGEFLSPTNSIGIDEDRLVKYFYFRPDNYEDPDADLENIFIIKSLEQFPKRYDLLAENNAYAVDTIEVSKRISDEEVGVTKVSYVVTANYDLLENIKKRENTGEEPTEDSGSEGPDEDGNEITSETKPWKYRAKWTRNNSTIVVPFDRCYGNDNIRSLPVLNSAGDRLISETEKYRTNFTYSKSYQEQQTKFDSTMFPCVNSKEYWFPGDYMDFFPAGTLLMLMPNLTVEYLEETENGKVKFTPYYNYEIQFIADYAGWDKELLNIGTRARFNGGPAEDIYHLVVYANENAATPETDTYTNLARVLVEKRRGEAAGKIVTGERVTEPMPLTLTGELDLPAILNPGASYNTLTFRQYQYHDFSTFPIKK